MPLAALSPKAAEPRFTGTNPIPYLYDSQGAARREVRDPCIIREGDTWYLVQTMWPFANREPERMNLPDNGSSPGIPLYRSTDLKDWKFDRWLVNSAKLPEDCPYKHRFWAPEIHKLNGKFYVISTADNWTKKRSTLTRNSPAPAGLSSVWRIRSAGPTNPFP